MEEIHITKSHNKSLLLYHLVCPANYRRDVFTEEVEVTLKKICDGISARYEINFVEIGSDADHVHFLVRSNLFFKESGSDDKKHNSNTDFCIAFRS